jgi:type II secretory pathway component GspD/PulD (secretin)
MLGLIANETSREVIDPAPIVAGSLPLGKRAQERYARARSLLLPKLDAYCQAYGLDRAEMTVEQLHCARGNASRLEARRAVAQRIAYLSRQDEAALADKRRRLEEFLWLVHEANPAELWEIAERVKTDEDGNEILDDDGKPVVVRYQRARFLAELPEDVARIVEGVQITESGKIVTKTYSKMQANQELRKLLGIGAVSAATGDDVGELSTTQIVAELNALGVEVKIGVSITNDR